VSLKPPSEAALVAGLAAGCVVVLCGFVLSLNQKMAMAVVLAAGVIFGPIFPTLMAILLGHFREAVHGRAVGMFFAIGGVGWTIIPLRMGGVARRTNVQRGFGIAALAAVALLGVTFILTVILTAEVIL